MAAGGDADDYIFSCVRHNRLDEVKAWLDAGGKADSRDYAGNTLLAVACQNGLKSMAKAALRAGGNINTANDVGNTPLHFCSAYGYADTLGAYILSKGADPGVRNKWGCTAADVRSDPAGMTQELGKPAGGAGGGAAGKPAPKAKSGGMWGFLRGRGSTSSSTQAQGAAMSMAQQRAVSGSYQGAMGGGAGGRHVSTPASAAAYMHIEGHKDDGRTEAQRWELASSMLSEEWPWRTQAQPAALGLTYLLRCEQVAWRVDDGKRIRWMPYCAGRRKAGVEEDSDF